MSARHLLLEPRSAFPPWVLRAGGKLATLDIDFVNDRAWLLGRPANIASLLTCTRASDGWYEKSDGTLQQFTSNQLRYGDRGLLVEGARTNLCLNNRDLTQAGSWNTNNNTTVAKTATGVDGTANAASTITATGANGRHGNFTNSSTGTTYTQSCYVRRRTGTGAVYMTYSTNGYVPTGSETVTGANLVTNGDFAADVSGWTVNVPSGDGTFTFDSGTGRFQLTTGAMNITQSIVTTPGKSYLLTFDLVVTSGGVRAGFGVNSLVFTTSGSKSVRIDASGSGASVTFQRDSVPTNFTIDNIVCKEISNVDNSITLTSSYQRFTRTFGGGNQLNLQFVLATSGDAIDVDFCQAEAGAFATSPIVTTSSSATRAADNVRITSGSWKGTNVGSMYASVGPNSTGANPRILGTNDSPVTPLYLQAGIQLGSFNGTAAFQTANSGTLSGNKRCATSYAAASRSLCLDGGAVATNASAIVDTFPWHFGSDHNTAPDYLNGFILRFGYWTPELASSVLQALTA